MAAEQPDLLPPADTEAWRRELAAKVSSYRAKRPRTPPRYPSLSLAFEPHDPEPRPLTAAKAVPPPPADEELELYLAAESEPQETGRVIEFPRPWVPESPPLDQLAEAVIQGPRILEVPEVVPPPPALGGMLIERPEPEAAEKRRGFEVPLNSALVSQRMLAAAVDGALVLAAFSAFAAVFLRFSPRELPLPQTAALAVPIVAVFWVAFKYLMLVHGGTTPGLRLAKLQLSCFDGSPAPRRMRQWRVAASLLSAASLGLGYAWLFMDEDELCWHDRITHTYLAPRG